MFICKFDQEFLDKILNNVENYVLKPQREGGGNNIYGNDIKCDISIYK